MAIIVKGGGGVVIPQDAEGKLYLKGKKPIVVNKYVSGRGKDFSLVPFYKTTDRYMGQDIINSELCFYSLETNTYYFINEQQIITNQYTVDSSTIEKLWPDFSSYTQAITIIMNHSIYLIKTSTTYSSTNFNGTAVVKIDAQNKTYNLLGNTSFYPLYCLAIDLEDNLYFLSRRTGATRYEYFLKKMDKNLNEISDSETLYSQGTAYNTMYGANKTQFNQDYLIFHPAGANITGGNLQIIDLNNFSPITNSLGSTGYGNSMIDFDINKNDSYIDVVTIKNSSSDSSLISYINRIKIQDNNITAFYGARNIDTDSAGTYYCYLSVNGISNNKKAIQFKIIGTNYLFNNEETQYAIAIVDDNNNTYEIYHSDKQYSLITFQNSDNFYTQTPAGIFKLQFGAEIY